MPDTGTDTSTQSDAVSRLANVGFLLEEVQVDPVSLALLKGFSEGLWLELQIIDALVKPRFISETINTVILHMHNLK